MELPGKRRNWEKGAYLFFLSLVLLSWHFGGIYLPEKRSFQINPPDPFRQRAEGLLRLSGQIGGAEEPDEFSAIAGIKTIMGKLENSRIKMQRARNSYKLFLRSPVGIALLDREGVFWHNSVKCCWVCRKKSCTTARYLKIFPRDLLKGISMIEELLAANREYQLDSRSPAEWKIGLGQAVFDPGKKFKGRFSICPGYA